jgi:hypothetical protein
MGRYVAQRRMTLRSRNIATRLLELAERRRGRRAEEPAA